MLTYIWSLFVGDSNWKLHRNAPKNNNKKKWSSNDRIWYVVYNDVIPWNLKWLSRTKLLEQMPIPGRQIMSYNLGKKATALPEDFK